MRPPEQLQPEWDRQIMANLWVEDNKHLKIMQELFK